MTRSDHYFDWQWWRLAWAGSWCWNHIILEDGSYRRLILGLWWRESE